MNKEETLDLLYLTADRVSDAGRYLGSTIINRSNEARRELIQDYIEFNNSQSLLNGYDKSLFSKEEILKIDHLLWAQKYILNHMRDILNITGKDLEKKEPPKETGKKTWWDKFCAINFE